MPSLEALCCPYSTQDVGRNLPCKRQNRRLCILFAPISTSNNFNLSLNLTSSPIYSLPHSRFCLVTQRLSCGDSSFLRDERFIDVCHSGNSLLSSAPVETKLVTVSLIHSTEIACKVSLFLLNEVYICLLKF